MIRTLHQALAAAAVLFPSIVVLADIPADKAASISASLVALITFVSKGYNLVWPKAEPLPPVPPAPDPE